MPDPATAPVASTPAAPPPAAPAASPAAAPAATPASLLGAPAAPQPGAPAAPSTPPAGPGTATPPATPAAPAALELKLPDGTNPDSVLFPEFQKLATEAKLEGPVAQKLLDLGVKMQARQGELAVEAWKQQDQKWVEAVKADPSIGGQNLEKTVTAARAGVRWAGGDALATALDELGVGNHPLLVAAFARIGQGLAEDKTGSRAGAPPPGEPTEQDRIRAAYPTMFNADGTPKY